MKWSIEAPVKPGWYWFRRCELSKPPRYIGVPQIVLVDRSEQQLCAWFAGSEEEEPVTKYEAQWAGPISRPEE